MTIPSMIFAKLIFDLKTKKSIVDAIIIKIAIILKNNLVINFIPAIKP